MHNSQELAAVIKQTAKEKHIPIGKMLSDCNLSVNTLSSMQSGGYYPRLEALARIADYLDCSVDYLLGRTDDPAGAADGKKNPALMNESEISAEIMALLAALPPEKLQGAMDYLRFLSESEGT